jgi:hypothetical protein
MTFVHIKCPVAGQWVNTGISCQPSTLRTLLDIRTRTHCPACGGRHVWTEVETSLSNAMQYDSPPEVA